MKKFLTSYIGVLTALAGSIAMLLQFVVKQQAFDEKGLMAYPHPALTVAFVFTAGILAVIALAVLPKKDGLTAFPKTAGSVLSAVITLVCVVALSLRKLTASVDRFSVICGVMGLISLLAFLKDGARYLQKKLSGGLFYGAASVFLLFHTLTQHRALGLTTQPARHFFPIIASVFLTLATFYRAYLTVGDKSLRAFLFFRYGAIFFSLGAIAHDPLFYAPFALSLLLSPLPVKKREMQLPETVCFCLDMLKNAGYEAYVVGGCVRDSLLGITPNDYDICTSATPEQTANVFSRFPLVRNGEKHGTIGVVIDHILYEITTFRTEGSYTDSRHPDWVEFVTSLEADLARRDFTVNAMAYSPTTGYVDPFGGEQDLKDGILRTVGVATERFTEDALRILRGVRFAVRFQLTPEEKTLKAMFSLAGGMESLARERVLQELQGLLPLITAEDLMCYAPIITQVIPELAPAVDFQQNSPHHAYDVYQHTAYVVEAVPGDLDLRFAALLHDVGKPQCYTRDENGRGHFYGHAETGAAIADRVLLRLKAPTQLRQQVVTLIENHMIDLSPDKKLLKKRLARFGEEMLYKIITLQEADFCSKGVEEDPAIFAQIRTVLKEILEEANCLSIKDLAIGGNDLAELGVAPGPKMGEILETLLEMVLDETLENEKNALLQAAEKLGGSL